MKKTVAFSVTGYCASLLKRVSDDTGIPMSRLVERATWLAYGTREGRDYRMIQAKYVCNGCQRRCIRLPELLRCPTIDGDIDRIEPVDEPADGTQRGQRSPA